MSNSQSGDWSAVPASLPVALDEEGKAFLMRAAELRGVSVSEYVWSVTVAQARREVLASQQQGVDEVRLEDLAPSVVLRMSPEAQLAFWNALDAPPKPLTPKQEELGRLMRGEL